MPTSTETQKAKRLENLRHHIEDLQEQAEGDLEADDMETRLKALAVKLIDHTYARIGNRESVRLRNHYGISQLECRHISFPDDDTAKIEYTGKKGVDQAKTIDDPSIVGMLQSRCNERDHDNDCIFCYEDDQGRKRRVSSRDINDYLSDFDVTAKDLRGYHANREMQEALDEIRSDNGELPEDDDEREEKLKEEFNEALDDVSDLLGHQARTLRNSYLVPHFEETYLEEGDTPDQLHKTSSSRQRWAMAQRLARRWKHVMLAMLMLGGSLVCQTGSLQAENPKDRPHRRAHTSNMIQSDWRRCREELPLTFGFDIFDVEQIAGFQSHRFHFTYHVARLSFDFLGQGEQQIFFCTVQNGEEVSLDIPVQWLEEYRF